MVEGVVVRGRGAVGKARSGEERDCLEGTYRVDNLVDQAQMIGLVAMAMGLGALVGFERERSDKPAGLRTHMLVAGACCMIALLGKVAFEEFTGTGGDPSRTLHGIVTGIGFLGAGSIIKGEGGRTEGLTTAASVLFVAVMGAAVALDAWALAAGATILAILTLAGVRRVEIWILQHRDSGLLGPVADAIDSRQGED